MEPFAQEKGIAFCGLACCVCSENQTCPGCRANGCPEKQSCGILRCCRERGLEGCWECSEFPCGQPMLQKPRVRAFCRLAARYGTAALTERLGQNAVQGMRYHWPGMLVGDYDVPESEVEIMELVFGDELR